MAEGRGGAREGAGAPEGNQNSSKSNRLWAETIKRTAIQDPDRLRRIAETLFAKAEEGDIASIKELGDRIDGKSAQAVALTGEDGGPVRYEKIIREIVDTPNSNA